MAAEYLSAQGVDRDISAKGFDAFMVEQINKPHHRILSKKGSLGINPKLVFAMRLMQRGKRRLTEGEKLIVARLISYSFYNKGFNQVLRGLSNENIKDLNLSPHVIKSLSAISYKAREADTYNRAFGKLEAIIALDKEEVAIPEHLRLTLHEVNVLETHTEVLNQTLSLSPYYNSFQETFEDETPLSQTYISQQRQLKETKVLLGTLTQRITRELGLQSGDIIQNIGQKYLSMNGNWVYQHEKILFDRLKYRHTGKVCLINGAPHVSDVWDEYRNFPIVLENLLVSDFQRIRVDKLVNPAHIETLREAYGDSWEIAVNDLYRSIEEEIHSDTTEVQYQSIYNTRMLQAKVGLSYLRPSLHTSRSTDRNFDSLHKKIMDRTYASSTAEKGMVCSEFAAKTTIAVLVELDNRLKKEIGTEDTVIQMPFSTRESLRYVNPNRLTKILDDAGCIEKVEPGETLAKFFVQDDVEGVTLS